MRAGATSYGAHPVMIVIGWPATAQDAISDEDLRAWIVEESGGTGHLGTAPV